jgi:hypothetical protein
MSPLHRLHKGQSYRLADIVDHTCRDGRETLLEIWQSACANCGQPFEFKRPQGAKHFWPNRRCKRCKRPGVRVGEVQL